MPKRLPPKTDRRQATPSRRRASLYHCVPALLLAACLAHSQTFDAASVKHAAGGRPDTSGGPGTKDPGRIHYANQSLQSLLLTAYNLSGFELTGPNWLDTERYDIDAVLNPDTTQPQFRIMLQNLLTARFRLELHRETKELSSYALVTTRSGPKLLPSTADLGPKEPAPDRPPLQLGKDGFFLPPRRAGMFLQLIGTSGIRETFTQSTIQELATSLQNQLHRPVTDATGLTGKYDFALTFAAEGIDLGSGRIPVNPSTVENPPDIAGALRSQLGLQLESRKAPVQLLVVDHAEKTPTEN